MEITDTMEPPQQQQPFEGGDQVPSMYGYNNEGNRPYEPRHNDMSQRYYTPRRSNDYDHFDSQRGRGGRYGGGENRYHRNNNRNDYYYEGRKRNYNNDRRSESRGYGDEETPRNHHSIEPMESYKTFVMKQEENLSPEIYQERYEQYKKAYHIRAIQSFFEKHKNEEWFKERYSPVERLEYQKKLNALRRTDAADFTTKIKSKDVRVCLDKVCCFEGEETVDNDMIPDEHILYIRRIPCECSFALLENNIKTALGEDVSTYQGLYLSDPCRKATFDFDRSGWIVFTDGNSAKNATKKLWDLLIHEEGITTVPFRLQVSQNRPRNPMNLSTSMVVEDRIEFDYTQALQVSELLDRELFEEEKLFNEEETEEPTESTALYGIRELLADEQVLETYTTTRMKLDLIIAYLRRVHYIVYYAGVELRDRGDIMHSHPALFVRPSEPSEKDVQEYQEKKSSATEGESCWSSYGNSIDKKIAEIRSKHTWSKVKETANNLTHMVKEIQSQEETELESIYNEYVIQSADGSEKHRCGLCKKLFKAAEFVQKHIKNKHPELVNEKTQHISERYMKVEFENDEHRPPCSSSEVNQTTAQFGGNYNRYQQRGGYHNNEYRGNGRGGRGGYRGRGGRGPRYMESTRGPHDQPSILGTQPLDPRGIVTYYQDLDKVEDTKVEVNFNAALNDLPPATKRQRNT